MNGGVEKLAMNGVEGERLRLFLQDTFDLWGITASITAGEAPLVAIIRADDGAIVWIEQPLQPARPERSGAESKDEHTPVRPERSSAESKHEHIAVRPERSAAQSKDERPPFRWAVRWRAAGEPPGAPRELRPRLCGSLVGVLSALRSALGVDRGTPVRIAPR